MQTCFFDTYWYAPVCNILCLISHIKVFDKTNIYSVQDAEVPIEDLLAFYYNPGNDRGEEDDDTGHVPLDDIQPEPLPPYDDHTEDMQQNGVDMSPTQSPIPQDSPPSRSASPSQSSSVNPPENQRITRGCKYAFVFTNVATVRYTASLCRVGTTDTDGEIVSYRLDITQNFQVLVGSKQPKNI